MSNFSATHPQLAIAFNGAAENISKRINLLKDSAIISTYGTLTGLQMAAAGATTAVLLPHVVIAAVTAATVAVLVDGVIGARRALKADKARKEASGLAVHRLPSRLTQAFKAFNATYEQKLDKIFARHPGLGAAAGASGSAIAVSAISGASAAPFAAVSGVVAAYKAKRNNQVAL